jgi:hypothetical protein
MNSPQAWQMMEYRIDRQGVLIYVSDSWTQFALDNASPDLVSERVVGQPLLNFVSDSETRHLYEIILERVRNTGVSVVLTLRCDSPSLRRFLQLAMSRLPGQEIQFLSHTLRTEPRESVSLLDPSANRSNDFLKICSWCKRILLPEDRWVEVEEAVAQLELFCRDALPKLTHGICPACRANVLAESEAERPPGESG